MSLVERLIRDILYPVNQWRSGECAELTYLHEFETTQWWDADRLQARSTTLLRALLRHAYQHCAFYRRQFQRDGVAPGDFADINDVRAFPILEKQHIQQYRDEMVSEQWPRVDLMPNMTGGSTGMPISFFASRDRNCSRNAAAWRHNRWAGWDIGHRVALLWGAACDAPRPTLKSRLRNTLIDRTIYLNTAHITEHALLTFDNAIKRFRPRVIAGYAKSLVLFARFLKGKGLLAYQPHSIIATAEVLESEERFLIESVFGCPVFNRYGCRELSVVASECSEHSGLHIMSEGLHVEVMCGDRPAKPGELGVVLVTDLLNFAMPLIRYRIGDMAVPEAGECTCRRGLPRLRRVEGRVTDFLVGCDGRLVSGAALTVAIVARRPTLGQVQIWQDKPGHVLYKIVTVDGKHTSPGDLAFLVTETRLYLGQDTIVEYEFVAELLSEPSGKFLFCRSSVASDFLDLSSSR